MTKMKITQNHHSVFGVEINPPNNNKKTVTQHGSNCIKKVSENPSPQTKSQTRKILEMVRPLYADPCLDSC